MVATKGYEDYVKAAVEAGADLIISGAGLPVTLPEAASGVRREDGVSRQAKLSPIVSSVKSANVIMKYWMKKYNYLPDLVVIEGPLPAAIWVLTGNSLRISKGCIMKKRSCVSWRP